MDEFAEVAVPPLDAAELEPIIGPERYTRLLAEATMFRERLGRRTIWNVSSTAVGGGVAEMLRVLAGYTAGLGIAIRWTVIGGDPEFFVITKRVHNQIHGEVGSAGPVGPADAGHYEQVLAGTGWLDLRPAPPAADGTLVPTSDPACARVVWRCHIGGLAERRTRAAWIPPFVALAPANGYVFTRRRRSA
jgi:trehalose synthase